MAKRKTGKKKPIDQYNHKDKNRRNNPPVGLVTPKTDPEILIRCPDKPLDRVQPIEYKSIDLHLEAVPAAGYTDRKTKRRILCGSI